MAERIDEIANFLRVSQDLITAGQPTGAQLRAVAEAGFEVVINLAPHEDPRSLPNESALADSLGLTYVNIPVPFASPAKEQLDAFCEAMDEHAGRRLFVHCLANKRVTAFLGLYAVMRRGEKPDAAFGPMEQVWRPNAIWAAFIEEALRRGGEEGDRDH